MLHLSAHPVRRAALAVLACFVVVLGILASHPATARAADGCTGPFTIGVSGPNGSSATQPAGQQLTLTVLAADGSPASTECPLDGKAVPSAMSYSWRGATFDSIDGATATVTPYWQGRLTILVVIGQQFVDQLVAQIPLDLTATAAPPTITTPSVVTAGRSSVLTGVPNRLTLIDPRFPQQGAPEVYAIAWDFGDGTTGSALGTSTSHLFTAPGTYAVRGTFYRDTSHSMGSAQISLTVYAPVVAAFTAPDSAVTGVPVAVDGTSSTSDDGAPVTRYSWDFGDGVRTTGPTPTHVYWTTGSFTVTETVSDSLGRTASTTHDITVSPAPDGGPGSSGTPPVAAFTTTTADPTAASPVSFDGTTSADGDGSIVSYAWAFGDGGTDSRMIPQHTYPQPGSYPVTLTVTDDDGLSGSVTRTVTVADAPPVASFTTPANPVAGSATLFDGSGSGDVDGTVQQYTWDFGDGRTGTGPTPTHPYAKAGSYDVVLTVTDDAGLTGTVTHTVTVAKAVPVADMILPAAAVATTAVAFDGTPSSDVDGTVQQYAWDFGDGQSGTEATPTHSYAKPGSYTVSLTVTDDDGLTGRTSRTLEVTGASPVAAFTAPTGAAGVSTAFDGTGSADPDGSIRSYSWDFGDGHTAIGATPGHTFETPNTYPVTLTVTDDSGLTDSVTHLVSVGAGLPSAVFVPGASAPTVGTPVRFDASGSTARGGITSYAWTFGDGGTGATATPSHTYKRAGSYPVTLTVTDADGHSASVTHVVNAGWPATDLAVSVGGSTPRAGQFAYRVTVKNLGRAGARGVVLTNTLDPTQRLAAPVKAPAGLRCGGVPVGATGTITCTAGPSAVLAPGRSWVVTVTVKQPPAPGVRQVTETSSVSASNPDPVAANDVAGLSTILGVRH